MGEDRGNVTGRLSNKPGKWPINSTVAGRDGIKGGAIGMGEGADEEEEDETEVTSFHPSSSSL